MIITFLSDFGDMDGWVASCKGQIFSIAPHAKILDVSHSIPSFDLKKGALVLASTLPFLPIGIHLAIVDPGVGGSRRGIVVKVERGDYLVGPDNKILGPAIKRLGGAVQAVEIKNKEYFRSDVCQTFYARDIFSPVAAALLLGTGIEELGPEIDTHEIQDNPWPEPKITKNRIVGEVIDIDKFGTIRSNIPPQVLQKAGISKGDRAQIE